MSTSLLATKLYLPPLRPNLVPRPRLTERLAQGLARPLTLISAPAGFGKTTLIGEWLASLTAHSNVSVAWLSLDQDDNDPAQRVPDHRAEFRCVVAGTSNACRAEFSGGLPTESGRYSRLKTCANNRLHSSTAAHRMD